MLLDFDKKLLVYLNNLGSEKWDAFWLTVTDQHFWWWFYILVILFMLRHFGWKKGLLLVISLMIIIAINDQLINLIKQFSERLRPCNVEELKTRLRILKCSPQFSFFSGHAANSFLLATYVFTLVTRKARLYAGLILFTWAALLAYSRIYVGVHYPSDVLIGMIEGVSVGYFIGQGIKRKLRY